MVSGLVQLKIASGVCSAFAIAITCSRLYMRRDRFWWDDACAFLSMIFLFVQVVSVFMHVPNPRVLTHMDNIAAYYLMAATFYAIIWTARLAILYSVIRIDPDPRTRRVLHRVGIIFIVVLLVMIAQVLWVCEPMPDWKNAASPQCPLDKQVAICQLITDIISDGLLITAPLRLIWGMDAEDGTRRRLMIIFSTSIVTTIVSLIHAAFILDDAGIRVVVAAIVEDTFSLIVCNIPVVVTAIMRRIGKDEEETDHSQQTTFRWRIASRRTGATSGTHGATTTANSDMATDLTPFSLRDFTRGARETVISKDVTLTQLDQTRTFHEVEYGADAYVSVDADKSGPGLGSAIDDSGAKPRQERSIMWITPDKLQRSESHEDDPK